MFPFYIEKTGSNILIELRIYHHHQSSILQVQYSFRYSTFGSPSIILFFSFFLFSFKTSSTHFFNFNAVSQVVRQSIVAVAVSIPPLFTTLMYFLTFIVSHISSISSFNAIVVVIISVGSSEVLNENFDLEVLCNANHTRTYLVI